ncbi:MAG: hypothetical protein AB7I41_22995 [Candidatus Sericytochromatia bacterium]
MRDCFLPALKYNYMYYTLLFLTGLFLILSCGFPCLALASEPLRHCPLTLNQRLELQVAQFSWQTWLNRPLPLWQGFAPQVLTLQLNDSDCLWLLSEVAPPTNSLLQPDFKRVFALPRPELHPDFIAVQNLSAQVDLPGFCRPLAAAFRVWGGASGLLNLQALEGLNGISSAQTGAWQRELLALERALQAGDKTLRQKWIRLFLAGRSQRLGNNSAVSVSEAGQTEVDLERILGLESWLCLRHEEDLYQSDLPEELAHLALFRNPVALFNNVFDRSQQGLTEIERLRHSGFLQVLILESLYPDWQKRISHADFLNLLSQWSAYQPQHSVQLAQDLARHFPEKQIKAVDPQSFEKQKGFLISLELNQENVDLRPQQVLGLSAEQFLLLPGSWVQIRHPWLWGDLMGLVRITNLPAKRLRLEFVIPLSAYLKLSQRPNPTQDLAAKNCEDLRLETPTFSLWGRCLRGERDLQGYHLRLPV